MYKLLVSITHHPEEYVVEINMYNDEGRLVDTRRYNGVKQVVFKTPEVRLSNQLSPKPVVLIVSAEKPVIDLKENTLLYIIDSEEK